MNIGERIGDYEIVEILGAGGMGQVYKVRNILSDRIEAMKVLLPNLEGDPGLADRFLNEIKVQATLDHPNIAKLHTAMRTGNQLVMVMEFVDGTSLSQALQSTKAHPMDEKKNVAEEIVARYHGAAAAKTAREYFERTVQQRELPTENVPEIRRGRATRIIDVMVAAGLAESKRAAERLVSGKGVRVDGILVEDPKAQWSATIPAILSVGSRKFVKVLPNE